MVKPTAAVIRPWNHPSLALGEFRVYRGYPIRLEDESACGRRGTVGPRCPARSPHPGPESLMPLVMSALAKAHLRSASANSE